MRTIQYERLIFQGEREKKEVDLLLFIMTEGYLAQFVNSDRQMPPLVELNGVLASGKGDDGFILMRWEPFTITDQDYAELKVLFEARQ